MLPCPTSIRLEIFADLYRKQRNLEGINRFLAAMVESSDDAIIGKDLDGIIATVNQGAQRLFGYEAEEMVGKPVTMLIPADRQHEEPEILARIQRGERVDHYDTIRRRKDGTLVNISITVSPVRDDERRIVGASKIAATSQSVSCPRLAFATASGGSRGCSRPSRQRST
jgi:PAS domain S-box-containing protein